MKTNVILILIFCGSIVNANSQDSIKQFSWKTSIIPVVLTGTGLIITGSEFEHKLRDNIREKTGENFNLKIDDYFRLVPVVEMYMADIAGITSKNHWFDQTKYLFISNTITGIITYGLKYTTKKTRPNGSTHSFPSGHTSLSYTNASVLYNEYKDTSPVLAYSGYFFSSTVGAFRIINDKHWLSDVLVGAGIGIIVTNLVYYFEPFKSFNPFRKHKKHLTIIPVITGERTNMQLTYLF